MSNVQYRTPNVEGICSKFEIRYSVFNIQRVRPVRFKPSPEASTDGSFLGAFGDPKGRGEERVSIFVKSIANCKRKLD